jgi:RNA polymerase primary sigma factor
VAKIRTSEYDDVRLYLIEAGRFKLLSRVEEQFLSRAYRDGDEEAGKKLVEGNLRLVVNVARKFQGRGLPMADLIQAGNEGLLRAVRKFDPDRGYKFSTYAMWWVLQGIRRGINTSSRLVALPQYASDIASESYRAEISLAQDLGRKPTMEEVRGHELSPMREMKLSEYKHERIVQGARSATRTVSLDQPSQGSDGLDPDSRATMIASDVEDPAEGGTFVREEILTLLKRLRSRDKFVIMRRYGIDGGNCWTLNEVADHLGISRERVRQIESLALRMLRRVKEKPTFRANEHKQRARSGPGFPRGWTRCDRCRCLTHKGRCKPPEIRVRARKPKPRCERCWFKRCRCG